MKREAEEEKQRARQAARERVLLEFEKGQLGLASTSTTGTTTSGSATEPGAAKMRSSLSFTDIHRQLEAQVRL